MEQAETQEVKKEVPQEPPKTDEQQYNEIQAKPDHKRSQKEREFASRFEANREEVRKHNALISKITDRAMAFRNTESGKVRRRITDKVAKVAPEANTATEQLKRERKAELEGLEKERRKEIKALNKRYDETKTKIEKTWEDAILDAQKGIREKLDQYEIDLKDALEDVSRQVDTFLGLIQIMDDDQMLEQLLEGKTVALASGDSKDYIVLPGT